MRKVGRLTFSVIIEDLDHAEQLLAEGWALKPLTDDDGQVEVYHLPIKANFASPYPPRVYRVSKGHEGPNSNDC